MWSLILSLVVPVGWAPDANARSTCGWQANHPGTRGATGFTITHGVEAMPRSLVVRTTVGTPAPVSAAVDHAIGAVNHAAGVAWRRGPQVAPSSQLSTADARHRPPTGELWVVGNPSAFPLLPPGTYASADVRRVDSGPAMTTSALVVLSSALGHPSLPHERRLNAVVHEFGHVAGLDHHFTPWQGACQMMSYRGGTSFGAGDTAGLRLLAGRSATTAPGGPAAVDPAARNPIGNLDAVRTTPEGIRVAGWALDPDTTGPLDIHLYVDGRFHSTATTNRTRYDVWRAHPAWGATRGYRMGAELARPASGAGAHSSTRVCAFAINAGPGSTNTLLGCRTLRR